MDSMDVNNCHSLLSDAGILEHLERGSVVIEPFNRSNLSTSSYDVTLGPYFFSEVSADCLRSLTALHVDCFALFNQGF